MLTKLTNFFKAPFKNNSPTADNRQAFLSDINALVDILKRTSPFGADTYSVLVTQSGGVTTPTLSVVGCSCISGTGSCPTCLVTPCAYTCKSAVTSFTQTGGGTYRLVVNPTDYDPFNEVVVEVGNLTVPGWVTVEKNSAYIFTIKTYNSAGVATSNLFSGTLMKINFYGKGGINYTT